MNEEEVNEVLSLEYTHAGRKFNLNKYFISKQEVDGAINDAFSMGSYISREDIRIKLRKRLGLK